MPGPQGRLVALRPDGRGQAVRGCTAAARSGRGEVIPPIAADGQPLDGEEVLLDGNELAAGHDFFSLGALGVSPDERWLAYSTDFAGDERFTMRIKDLATGELRCPTRSRTRYYGCAWSLDGSVAVLRDRRRRLAALPGVAARGSAPRRTRTRSSSRRRTSGSGSASA